MKRNIVLRNAGFALWVAVIFAALPAYGMLAPVTLEELVKSSSHIVVGKVVDLVPRWVPGAVYERIYPNQHCTDVIVSVGRYLKGSGRDALTVRLLHGMIKVLPGEEITLPDGQVFKHGATIIFPSGRTWEVPMMLLGLIVLWFSGHRSSELTRQVNLTQTSRIGPMKREGRQNAN